MNRDEKKALIRFLSIYVSSTLFLISVILYVYYANELKMVQESCHMELKSASMEIKTDILDKHMKKKEYIAKKFLNKNLKYALFDSNKKEIFSYIDNRYIIDYSKKFYENSHYHYYIELLEDEDIPIKYIVIESSQVVEDRNTIKMLILIKLIISSIFIGCVGYLLSKILLKPVRQRVESMDKFIKDSTSSTISSNFVREKYREESKLSLIIFPLLYPYPWYL